MKIMKRFFSIFSVVIGVSMLGLWLVLIASGQVVEFDTRPNEITLHLIAEGTTAIILIAAGIMGIRSSKYYTKCQCFASGMLMYTVIVSPGYYLDLGEPAIAWMFAAIFSVLIWQLYWLFKNEKI